MNNRNTPIRARSGLMLTILLAVTITAYAAQRMSGLQIGPNPSTTNIDLQGDGDIVAVGTVTAAQFSGGGAGITGLSVSTAADSAFRVQDNGDVTKQIAFEAGGIATGTTRTITMPDAAVNLGDIATNNAKVTNATHTGDVTGSGILTIAAGAVDIAHHSATGTPDSTTFLRGDNTWNTPAGGGDMTMAGVQTVTGAKSFNDAKLILNGSASGTTTLKANTTAGATTATLQAATGILAYTADIPADTDDLTEGATNRYVSTGDETKLGYLSVTQPVNMDALETDVATLLGGPTLGSFDDDVFAIVDDGDATKRGLFQASAITTATDRTYTLPDASGTLALTSGLHSAATVSGAYDYLTLSGQDLVRGQVDLATDVTGYITNAQMNVMGLNTIKGRDSVAGQPSDLTVAEVLAMLGVFPDAQVSDTLTSSLFVGSGSSSTAIDLATAEVAGDLPLANIAQFAAGAFAGRALGGGTGDLQAMTNAQTRASISNMTALTSTSNAVAWTAANASKFTHTLSENTTIGASTGADGQCVLIMITKASTYTWTWNAQFKALDGLTASIPAIPTTAGDIGYYYFIYNEFLDDWVLQFHTEYQP